jgi:HAD superfamily hydrolase (TIGR01509 family)
MIKAVLFDCFGVLVGRGFDETYRMAGGDPRKDHMFIQDVLGQANLGLIDERTFESSVAQQLEISEERFRKAAVSAEQPNVELLEYIVSLRPAYKTGVVSNVNKGGVERKIGEEWARRCFDVIVASGDIGIAKPERGIYEIAADRLQVQTDECVFVDDREDFCDAARGVGMQTIRYDDFTQFKGELDDILNGDRSGNSKY